MYTKWPALVAVLSIDVTMMSFVRLNLVVGLWCCFQALFFGFIGLTPYEGFYWMGATVICLAGLTVPLLYWPM